MPIRPYIEGDAFDPEIIQIMSAAYEETCRKLQLVDRTDPITELVAKRIIEIAKRGERDPIKLRELLARELDVSK
jgi:hypothetical protein